MRLFFAIEANSPTAAQALGKALELLRASRADVRWVAPLGWHLTLAFLGSVPEERVGQALAVAMNAARRFAPFSITFSHVGVFPSWSRPRVLWVGLGKGAETLNSLALALAEELRARGFELEDRAFLPHLTLGRFRSRRKVAALKNLAESMKTLWAEASVQVREIVLMESRLSREGACYTVRERIPIGLADGR